MKKIFIASILVVALFLGVSSVASANGYYGCQSDCYVVQKGDTLFSIGRHYDIDPYYLAHVNGLQDPNWIYYGQVLYIPSDGPRYPGYHHANYPCYQDCYKQPYHKRVRYDKCNYNDCYDGGYGHDYNKCYDKDCYDSGYGHGNYYGKSYYGYDYTGYHYGSNKHSKNYSYTCGYYSNCW